MKWKTRLWRFDSLCEIRGKNEKILTALLLFLSPLSFAQEKVSLADVPLKRWIIKPYSLSQYQGKPLYIKMWASWCPICLAGLAEIDDLSAEKNLDFNVITIASPGQKNEQNGPKSSIGIKAWITKISRYYWMKTVKSLNEPMY